MSTNRRRPDAGWRNSTTAPRGPNGRQLCRKCGVECVPPRISFCSDACVHEWKIQTNPRYVRQCVERRDSGVCARCGLDTAALHRSYMRSQPTQWYSEESRRHFALVHAWLAELGFPSQGVGTHATLWHADHIVPVVEGGGECTLDNYRTLCVPCHKVVTAELRARLKLRKRYAPLVAALVARQLELYRRARMAERIRRRYVADASSVL